jgi:hypothetical protein
LPRAFLEVALVAATDERARLAIGGSTLLELDGYLTERLARAGLGGERRLRFDGRKGQIIVARPRAGFWRFTAALDGTALGQPVAMSLTLVIDGLDGLLPYELPPEVGPELGLRVYRPGVFKASPRVLDHYVRERERIETTLWLWFTDRQGGLAGAGALYDFKLLEYTWTDGRGEARAADFSGPEPAPLQGTRLEWSLLGLPLDGVDRLDLDLELSVNLFPVRVRASFARGADRHEAEPAWMLAAPPETEIGEPPAGVEVIRGW